MQPDLVPSAEGRLVTVEFDHRPYHVPEGISVLHAAELCGLFIPSLCSHRELSPFGGCRLCTVEIEGLRGYPLACSTVVQDGMKVLTDTVALREMRLEILRLILSEHPASCLVCSERDHCRPSMGTIRKTGVTTGCRSCPKDGVCELQALVERLDVQRIGYPIAYRGFEAEHDDPFYDRDYNLCILCGRCVRMCQEVRGSAVLAFTFRGPRARIGPAFGQSHLAAGCEFCGACVSVCPTGALADKVSKWDGAPDGVVTSTCPFCSLGCQIDIAHKNGRLSWVHGSNDPAINDGQLCVRGRFCLPETTHHHDRARKPMVRREAHFRSATWDEALDAAAERLAGAPPEEILVLVSGDLSNEGLYAAQRFARQALGTPNLDSTARRYLPGGAETWSRLFALPISLRRVAQAEHVVVAGLDSRFHFSVVGVQVRRAMRSGARLTVVDARESSLAQAADEWLRPPAAEECAELVYLLRSAKDIGRLAVVIAPRVFEQPGAEELVCELERLAQREGVTVLPLVHGANTRGALELGALSGVAPGPQAVVAGRTLDDLWLGWSPRVLYLIGESPFVTRPEGVFVIAQDMYLPPFGVDVFLPATSFAETAATITSLEGRVLPLQQIEELPEDPVHGYARPDWRILAELATRLGHPELADASAAAVREAIRAEVPDFPLESDRSRRRMRPMGRTAVASAADVSAPAESALDLSPASTSSAIASAAAPQETLRRERAEASSLAAVGGNRPRGADEFLLVPERGAFRYRGIDLATVVEGLTELGLESGLRMSPADMAALGVQPGDEVTLTGPDMELVIDVVRDDACPPGTVYLSTMEACGRPLRSADRQALERLSRLPAQPVRVSLRPGEVGARTKESAEAGTGARSPVCKGRGHV